MILIRLIAVLLTGAALAAPAAPGPAQKAAARPSFACANAQTVAERMICGDVELARLDRIMGDLFAESRSLSLNAQQAAEMDGEQRAWLSNRNRCGAVECLRQAYFRRIIELARGLPANS